MVTGHGNEALGRARGARGVPRAPYTCPTGHDGLVADVEVRALRRDEHRAAGAVTCRALADSPTTVASYGPDMLEGLVHMHGELVPYIDALPSPQWAAFAGDCVIALAAVAPPGECVGAFMAGTPGLLRGPPPELGDPARAHVFWAHWSVAEPAEEHWHVGPVGVEPGYQGRGIGAAVMRALCASFDQEPRMAWLETDKERNVRFYAGLGFEVVTTETILDVPTWYMRRDPR
jgi:ribosomal protein S18 acetylase RimI-like enzyme